jgi:hypothetical protein
MMTTTELPGRPAWADKLVPWIARLRFLLLPLAIVLWTVALRRIDFSEMTDLGLISVMPPISIIALVLMCLSFTLNLRREPLPIFTLLMHIVVLVIMIFGITAVIEVMPRFNVNWRHIGIIDYITRHGSVNPRLDAYFNWPAFFIANSFITRAVGLDSAISFVSWAPVFFNLLYLMPLISILQTATQNRRAILLGVWLFYLGNWIGQDYFSPQAINYFFYLTIVAVLLKWFKTEPRKILSLPERWQRVPVLSRLVNPVLKFVSYRTEVATQKTRPAQRLGLILSILVIFAAATTSHQLTPFGILASVGALVVFNRVVPRGLPILMAVIIAIWIAFVAVTYLKGHISQMMLQVGDVSSITDHNVVARLTGSHDHNTVVKIRLLMSGVIWSVALLGAFWRLHLGFHDLTWGLLVLAPFVLLGLQDYGGEMILRVYFFSLPFMLIFVVSLFYPKPIIRPSLMASWAIFAFSSAMAMGFLFSRYGNENMDYKTPEEIDGIRTLYEFAEPGALLIALRPNVAWRFEDYETYHYRIADDALTNNDPAAIAELVRDYNSPAYVVITRTQRASAEMFLDINSDRWAKFQADLQADGLKIVFTNSDTTILTFVSHEIKPTIPLNPLDISGNISSPRVILALVFLFFLPGLACVRLLHLSDLLLEWTLAIALSLALDIIVPTLLLYARLWHPDWAMAIMVVITISGVILSFSQRLKGVMVTRKQYKQLNA